MPTVTFQLANLRKHSIRHATSSHSAADKAQGNEAALAAERAAAARTQGFFGRLHGCVTSLPHTLFHHG
jgi:hypothetical protein